MQQTPPAQPRKPLYSIRSIAVGTLLGSLAGGAAMLWLNYRNLGYPALANRVAVIGLLFYIILVGAASLLPNEPLPGVLFIAVQTGIAYWAASGLQGRAIAYHQQQGGPMHSTLRGALAGFLAGIAVIFVMLTIILMLGTGSR